MGIEEPYEKCKDWNLRGESSEYYYLLLSTGARMAGLYKAGKLGDAETLQKSFQDFGVRTRESFCMQPGITGKPTKEITGKLDIAINFVSDTGKIAFPNYVTALTFKNKLKSVMM